jgi:hypothetical protein
MYRHRVWLHGQPFSAMIGCIKTHVPNGAKLSETEWTGHDPITGPACNGDRISL